MSKEDQTIEDYGLPQPKLQEVAPIKAEKEPPFSFYPDEINDFTLEDVYRAANIKLPTYH